MPTGISWTDETWNVVTGCSKVSEGCRNCYAEALSIRFGWSKLPWSAANASANIILHPERLSKPNRFKPGTRVFVNSMADLFHDLVPDSFLESVFDVMWATPHVTYQILTKRPERPAAFSIAQWPPNVWLGTSIEDHRVFWPRYAALTRARAQVRFISFEPLIGSVIGPSEYLYSEARQLAENGGLIGIDWAIIGGESGPGFRPMSMAWAREIRNLCRLSGTAVFFKQDAAFRTETHPHLCEEDRSCSVLQEYPQGAVSVQQRVENCPHWRSGLAPSRQLSVLGPS